MGFARPRAGDLTASERFTVCGLGAALPQAATPRLNARPNTTNRNNRSQPLLNSYVPIA